MEWSECLVAWYLKTLNAWRRNKRRNLSLCNEHKGKCPQEVRGEKCFLEGVEERSPAKNLMGHKQKGGTGRLQVTETKTEVKQLKTFCELVPGSGIRG